ncbi:MAG TPA: hypothetical protein VGC53_05310 [Vicinamibacteria bacterium]
MPAVEEARLPELSEVAESIRHILERAGVQRSGRGVDRGPEGPGANPALRLVSGGVE